MGQPPSSSRTELAGSPEKGAGSASRHRLTWQAVCCTQGGDVHLVTLTCSPGLGYGTWHAASQVRTRPHL